MGADKSRESGGGGLKVRLRERHLRFLGDLSLCGTLHSQKTMIRTAAALGILLNQKNAQDTLERDFINYFELDDKTIFYLIFNHRGEADSIKGAAQVFGRYSGRGLDIIASLLENKDMSRLTLDDILDEVDAFVVKRMGSKGEKKE